MTTSTETAVAGNVNGLNQGDMRDDVRNDVNSGINKDINFVELTREDLIHMLRFRGVHVTDDANLHLDVFTNGAAQATYDTDLIDGNTIRLGSRAAA